MNKLPILLTLLTASLAFADDIRLGQPAFGGTGCPGGTTSLVPTADQKGFKLATGQFYVEAGKGTGHTLERKACSISIPVHVPQGYSIALSPLSFNGFSYLSLGTKSVLKVETFFAGGHGPIGGQSFSGPMAEDYSVSVQSTPANISWSPCGADTNLRVNASILVQTNSSRDTAFLSVDEIGEFRVQYRLCN